MNKQHLIRFVNKLPTHLVLVGMVLIWLVPTLGLLVTSLRPYQAANTSGWWTVVAPPAGSKEYTRSCQSCHGKDGHEIAEANLTDPELVGSFNRSTALMASLRKEIDGKPHLEDQEVPDGQAVANILAYMKRISGLDVQPRFTLNNYIDALMGYRGTATYVGDCETNRQALDLSCTPADLLNPRGIGRAFLNSLLVAVPATLLPLLFAAFAGYSFSWFNFRGRMALFVTLVGLQVVPLQMVLVPVSRVYAQMGLNGSFIGIWLFHTGFGLPYAIYLMRNFLGSLPQDLFESAYLDGASHWTAFYRLALPLAMPAIASLAIFQFLWVWNDLLVALVFLGGSKPVLTYQISNMVTSLGAGWHLLTASAFLSFLLPMVVFFSMQRYFVRGMLAGSVKG